jgi:hypothetical protein
MLQLLTAEDSHAGLDWTGCFPRYVHRPIHRTQWGEDMGMNHAPRVWRLSTSAHLLPPGFHYLAQCLSIGRDFSTAIRIWITPSGNTTLLIASLTIKSGRFQNMFISLSHASLVSCPFYCRYKSNHTKHSDILFFYFLTYSYTKIFLLQVADRNDICGYFVL